MELNDNTKSTNFRTTIPNNGSTLNIEKYTTGQQVAVGYHKVEIIKYLTEGGFAQIYVVKFLELLNEFNADINGPHLKPGALACLKRVMVQDERGLEEMRNEVEVMKLLSNKPNVVQYYDSNATRNHHNVGGFEVLLLMEFCPNESLLTYLNQRLATKLTEQEILKIMYDISIGISQLHYLEPTLIHRDIKIENVLVDSQNNFKLCDFGSTIKCPPIATTYHDIAILSQDIYVHTTPQYRSPEMIDLFRYLPINEKSDIWALGVFLYKLLFYTTPFEHTGQFAILHSKYDIPRCKYSPQLINLIVIMLCENPYMRPNIYQVVYGICSILNVDVPIPDKYGIGPYNFDNFIVYQKKSQNLQRQLFTQMTNTNIDNIAVNSNIVSDAYLEYFDAMPKIQEIKTNLQVPTQLKVTRTRSITSDEKLSRHTTVTIDSNRSTASGTIITANSNGGHDTNENIVDDNVYSDNKYSKSETKINSQTNNSNCNNNTYTNETPKFPTSSQNPFEKMETIPSTNNNFEVAAIPKNQPRNDSHHSSGNQVSSVNIDDMSNESPLPKVHEQRINYSKPHKSNNPFPDINNKGYGTIGILNNDENTRTDTTVATMTTTTKGSNNIFNIQQTTHEEHHEILQNPPSDINQQAAISLPSIINLQRIQTSSFTEQQSLFSESTNQGNTLNNERIVMGDFPIRTTTTTTNNKDIQNNKYNKILQSKNLTKMPFPPPIVTQYSHKLESTQNKPCMNHQSPFPMDSNINIPNKSIPVSIQSLPLNKDNNVKKSSNPFPYIQNIDINRTSSLINESAKPNGNNMNITLMNKNNVNASMNETPRKLQTNTVNQEEGNLIDISPVVRKSSISSASDKNEKDENDSSDMLSISQLKKTNIGSRPLQFSLDEVNLSQESSFISGILNSRINVGKAESDNENSSIASSESINLNLNDEDKKSMDNTRSMFENLKIDNNGSIQRGKSIKEKTNNSNLLRMDRGEFAIDSKRNRHSLDLELQEINFSTQSLNLSSNTRKNKTKNNKSQITVSRIPLSSNNNSPISGKNHNNVKDSSKVYRQEPSSVATHQALNREIRTKNRSKLPPVRQSLDIERLRKDSSLLGISTGNSSNNSNGANSKRRLFFSLFKGDKN